MKSLAQDATDFLKMLKELLKSYSESLTKVLFGVLEKFS